MYPVFNILVPRNFGTSCVRNKVVVRVVKSRLPSSIAWLRRQFADPYVEKARLQNYRCRSAFKLLDIDNRYHILQPGHVVVDCGAAPGSWCQVAVARTNALKKKKLKPVGTVIGIDLKPMYPLDGATFFDNLDFTTKEAKEKVMGFIESRNLIGPRGSVNVVLSDMSPNASGNKFLDHTKVIQMSYDVLKFALSVSTMNASFLVKLFDGEDTKNFVREVKKFYNLVKYVKPNASRKESAEIYILATGFKGKRKGLVGYCEDENEDEDDKDQSYEDNSDEDKSDKNKSAEDKSVENKSAEDKSDENKK